ncbi:MAG: dephospho-CoA kinase [Chloroflexota bacterium]
MNKWPEKRVIGLGGSLGTGKDTVSEMLERVGIFAIDADEATNNVIQQDAPGYRAIKQRFGEQVLNQAGQVDWTKLYQIARADHQARDDLQAILAPIVREEIIHSIQQVDGPVVIIKATSLSELGLQTLCDRVWVVSATEEVQVTNLAREFGWSDPQARQYVQTHLRIDSQLAHANVILYNTGSRGALWRQIVHALQELESQTAGGAQPAPAPEAAPRSLPEQAPAISRSVAAPYWPHNLPDLAGHEPGNGVLSLVVVLTLPTLWLIIPPH